MADPAEAHGAARPPDPELATAAIAGGSPPRGQHVALVPGEEVPLIRLDLPAGLRGAARERVAQRQLTDMLGAGAAEVQMRPCALNGAADAWDRVLVADRARLARWRGEAGRRCQAVLPDYLALPVAEGLWTIASEEGRLRARFGPDDGATTSEPALCLQAARLIEAGRRPERVLRFGQPLPDFEAQMAAAGIEVVTDASAAGLPPLRAFARGELRLDLRADPQAARSRLLRQVRAWRWPVLTGAVAAALWAAAQLTVIRATKEETVTLTAQTLRVTREVFVPEGPVLDVRVQIARALADRRATLRAETGEVSPLDLFSAAAPVIAGAGARPQSVSWEPSGGLRLVLEMADFAAVDALVEELAANDLRVTVEDARLAEDTGRVTAELDVRLPEQGG